MAPKVPKLKGCCAQNARLQVAPQQVSPARRASGVILSSAMRPSAAARAVPVPASPIRSASRSRQQAPFRAVASSGASAVPRAVRMPVPASPIRSSSHSRQQGPLHAVVSSEASAPLRRKVKTLENEVEKLRKQKETTELQASKAKKDADDARSLHADAELKLMAEDTYWRKRFRTLQAETNKWLKAVEASQPSSVGAVNLDLLAAAAAFDAEAEQAEEAERQAAAAAAAALLEAQEAVREAQAKQEAADKALEAAVVKEAGAKEAEAGAITRAAQAHRALAHNKSHAARSVSRQSFAVTNADPGTPAYNVWKGRQKSKIREFLVSLFGTRWHTHYVDECKDVSVGDPYHGHGTDPEHVLEILDSFFQEYQDLFDALGDPIKRRGYNIAAKVEESVASVIQEQFDAVVIPLVTQCDLTEHAYQCLINYTSNLWDGENMVHFKFPHGTPMPKWMSKNKMLELKAEAALQLGLDIKPGSAWLSLKAVLVQRIRELIQQGFIKIPDDGSTPVLRAQILGDATTVWKSMRVNGTSIVAKVLYNDKNADGDKDVGTGVNSFQNQRAIGFYLGDDTQKELKQHAPDLNDQMQDLVDNGIEVDGHRFNIQLLLGGDLKFINSMLGLCNNASHFPCPFCIIHKSLLACTTEELDAISKAYYASLPSLKEAHLHALRSSSSGRGGRGGRRGRGRGGRGGGGRGQVANEEDSHVPKVYLGPRTNEVQQQLAHLASSACCPGHKCWTATVAVTDEGIGAMSEAGKTLHHQLHFSTPIGTGVFFRCIELKNVLVDALHVVLRVVPALYRATVSAHVDSSECRSIAQWIYDLHGVTVSSSTNVQSATGNESTIGTECWPGPVCDKLMEIYPEILLQAHPRTSENLQLAKDAWDAFFLFQEELVDGCNDDDPNEVAEHSRVLKELAEDFVKKYIRVSANKKVTPYMHIMMVDIPRMVLLHGSLVKYSSQGVERLHQYVKFITMYRSNRKHKDVSGKVAKDLALKTMTLADRPARRKGKKRTAEGGIVQRGGKMSTAARQQREERKTAIMDSLEGSNRSS